MEFAACELFAIHHSVFIMFKVNRKQYIIATQSSHECITSQLYLRDLGLIFTVTSTVTSLFARWGFLYLPV